MILRTPPQPWQEMTGAKHLPEAGQDRNVPSGSPGRWTPGHPPSSTREPQTQQHCRSVCEEACTIRSIESNHITSGKRNLQEIRVIALLSEPKCAFSVGVKALAAGWLQGGLRKSHRQAQLDKTGHSWTQGDRAVVLGAGGKPTRS